MMKWYKVFALLGVSVWMVMSVSGPTLSQSPEGNSTKATFAGGCFWCMEHPFDELDGVVSTTSGYTGGHTVDPTYPEVSAGGTGHTEAVQIEYDPTKVTYEELLKVYWRNVDPTTPDAQFCDHGNQYRPEIFYHTKEQQQLAEASKTYIEKTKTFPEPIVVEITEGTTFYPAEDFHQNYYQTNPIRYKFYRLACGRDSRLTELWGDA
jgi:peptide-methionine (S)-S-oxide reductase